MKTLVTILILLFVYLQYRLWFGDGGLQEVWNLEQQVESQKMDNAQLKERNETLEAEVKDLKQGVEAIEERARKDMGMIRQGETFYQIIDEPSGEK